MGPHLPSGNSSGTGQDEQEEKGVVGDKTRKGLEDMKIDPTPWPALGTQHTSTHNMPAERMSALRSHSFKIHIYHTSIQKIKNVYQKQKRKTYTQE